MKIEFTPDYILSNQGCYIETPGKVDALKFMSNPVITLREMFRSIVIKERIAKVKREVISVQFYSPCLN